MTPTIKNNGFTNVVAVELYFEIHTQGNGQYPVSLYMKHGSPARGDWFTAYRPVGRYATVQEAQDALDVLAGMVDAHKEFPIL